MDKLSFVVNLLSQGTQEAAKERINNVMLKHFLNDLGIDIGNILSTKQDEIVAIGVSPEGLHVFTDKEELSSFGSVPVFNSINDFIGRREDPLAELSKMILDNVQVNNVTQKVADFKPKTEFKMRYLGLGRAEVGGHLIYVDGFKKKPEIQVDHVIQIR